MPDIFKIEDFDKNKTTQWKYTKQDATPHQSAYKEFSEYKIKRESIASVVSTRYHRAFDGD